MRITACETNAIGIVVSFGETLLPETAPDTVATRCVAGSEEIWLVRP